MKRGGGELIVSIAALRYRNFIKTNERSNGTAAIRK
jgi:hypothetical protein